MATKHKFNQGTDRERKLDNRYHLPGALSQVQGDRKSEKGIDSVHAADNQVFSLHIHS